MSKAVYINNVSAFLPNEPVSNDEMEQVLGMIGEKPSRARRLVLRQNGIKERYYAIDRETGESNYSNAELTAEAIRKLENDTLNINNIECLVSSTSNPDQLVPNHGVMVHGELEIPPCEVLSTSGICLCGLTALKYAYMTIASGDVNNAVASGTEVSSNAMRAHNFAAEHEEKVNNLEKNPEIAFEKDFLRWMLSDGAGAVWLSNEPNINDLSLKIEWIDTLSFANEQEACMYGGAEKTEDGNLKGWSQFSVEERNANSVFALKQDVKQLNEHIVKVTVEKALQKIMSKRNLVADDIDYFLPHYSSGYFKDKLYQGLKNVGFEIPFEKWFTNLTTKGNTGSASIYIILEELFNSGKLKVGEKLLCYVPESGRFSSGFMLLTVV